MNYPVSVLGKIQSPADLKALSEAELEQLAAEASDTPHEEP